MPPATEPVMQLILDNLQTTLALPDGGSSYFYDFNVVKVGEDIFQAATLPAVTIGTGSLGRVYEERSGRVLWTDNMHWRLPIVCALSGYVDDEPKRLIRAMHDIHKALMTDRTRGGNALETNVIGAEILATEEGDTRSWIVVDIEVHFRTKDTDMLVLR